MPKTLSGYFFPEIEKSSTKSVDIISPAFSYYCLQRLEELSIENKALFLDIGGEKYHYISLHE